MNAADILIVIILIAAAALAVVTIVRKKKSGSSCCGSCSACRPEKEGESRCDGGEECWK